MTIAKSSPEEIALIRFDLDAPMKKNFSRYQDALDQNPGAFQVLKLLYDQYLKTVSAYRREQQKEKEREHCEEKRSAPQFVFQTEE